MIKFKIFTLFPEIFPGALAHSVTGKALEKQLWQIQAINIRNYGIGKHKEVDDIVYGGGCGMLIRPDVIADALEDNLDYLANSDNKKTIIYLSPRGNKFSQEMAYDLAQKDEIALLCGRYEGIDQRVIDEYNIIEVSIGDYVLSGGEIAAIPLIDAVVRNIPNVLGDDKSLDEESFTIKSQQQGHNLLEYNQYTRPDIWRGRAVPEILKSGNHKKIEEWRQKSAIAVTTKNRPDLLKS